MSSLEADTLSSIRAGVMIHITAAQLQIEYNSAPCGGQAQQEETAGLKDNNQKPEEEEEEKDQDTKKAVHWEAKCLFSC